MAKAIQPSEQCIKKLALLHLLQNSWAVYTVIRAVQQFHFIYMYLSYLFGLNVINTSKQCAVGFVLWYIFRFKVNVDGNDKRFCKVFPLRFSLLLKKMKVNLSITKVQGLIAIIRQEVNCLVHFVKKY